MDFHIGEKVIHSTFGIGEIAAIEEMEINGLPVECYLVRVSDMTVYVPVNSAYQNSLRTPTAAPEFLKTVEILSSPFESLAEDRLLRKNHLMTLLRDGRLSSICEVVRDLHSYQQKFKLNDQEKNILEQAVKSLLTEWTLSLEIPNHEATLTMESLLNSGSN